LTLILDTLREYGAYVLNPKLRKITAREMCLVTGRVLEQTPGGGAFTIPVPNALVTVTPNVPIPLDFGWGNPLESYEAITDAQGYFSIIAAITTDTDFVLTATCDEYQYFSRTVVLHANDTARLNEIYMTPVVTTIRPAAPPLSSRTTVAVYPQPAQSAVTVELPAACTHGDNSVLSLVDMQGRLLWSRSVTTASATVSAPAAGMYLLKAENSSGQVSWQTIQFTK
jgi:hypothetical protein